VSYYIFSESSKTISSFHKCIPIWALYEERVHQMNTSGTFRDAVIPPSPPKKNTLNFREYFDRLYTKKDKNMYTSHPDFLHKVEQYRQCTHQLTLRGVRVINVAVEEQEVLHILSVCSVRYPAYNAYSPYYTWSLRLHNIFPHYLIKTRLKKQLYVNACIEFLYKFCLKIFLLQEELSEI
jgi:hypothetical protein